MLRKLLWTGLYSGLGALATIAARARGKLPTDQEPGAETPPLPRPKSKVRNGRPSPLVVIAGAFAVGVMLAKFVDWRGHAHPRI